MNIRIITEPTIFVLAETRLQPEGLARLVEWVAENEPSCLPANPTNYPPEMLLFPYNGEASLSDRATDPELLVELAGRACYRSFGLRAGRKGNAEYIANLLGGPGKIPHGSVLYHSKATFWFGGISRRMSHELIRHYVGADRSEEGSPSQESTRYTHHNGSFVAHPRMLGDETQLEFFRSAMRRAYSEYTGYISDQYERLGEKPKGMERKRIYEAAASLLPGAASTSMVWTTNPAALDKLFRERCDSASDLEFQRFARKLRKLCYERWPNLFRDSNPACKEV